MMEAASTGEMITLTMKMMTVILGNDDDAALLSAGDDDMEQIE